MVRGLGMAGTLGRLGLIGLMGLIIFVAGMTVGKRIANSEGVLTKRDTVRTVVYDTITFFRPVAKDSVAVRYVTRVLPVELGVGSDECGVDSDSVRVVMPITQRTYETEDYKAWVSGYEARLDSIFVFNRTVRERVTVPAAKPQGTVAARMGIGVVGGVGYGIINRQPDIFVGVAAYVRLWP